MRTVFLSLSLLGVLTAAEPEIMDDHQSLRLLLEQATTALNTRHTSDLAPLLAPQATLTFVDQTRCRNATDIEAAFTRWLGPDTDLASVTFAPKIDGPATIIGTTALATGISHDLYHLKNGYSVTVPTTWSATLIKDAGTWRVASLHCGVNLVDNPILTLSGQRVASAWQKIALAALTLGLAIGAVLGYRWKLSPVKPAP